MTDKEAIKSTPSEEAISLAVGAWCTPRTRNTVMDPDLAFEFADIIEKLLHPEITVEVVDSLRNIDI